MTSLLLQHSKTFIPRLAICQLYVSDTKSSLLSEAVVQECSVKKVFIEISQNSKENTCARVSF